VTAFDLKTLPILRGSTVRQLMWPDQVYVADRMVSDTVANHVDARANLKVRF
jgi:hypothetical protein